MTLADEDDEDGLDRGALKVDEPRSDGEEPEDLDLTLDEDDDEFDGKGLDRDALDRNRAISLLDATASHGSPNLVHQSGVIENSSKSHLLMWGENYLTLVKVMSN